MSTKRTENKSPERKTLLQLQTETKVRDPAAHSKLQVTELDKTAKRSQLKRKECKELIESDAIAIIQLEEQIQMLKQRFILKYILLFSPLIHLIIIIDMILYVKI